jgi:hypothetical protein
VEDALDAHAASLVRGLGGDSSPRSQTTLRRSIAAPRAVLQERDASPSRDSCASPEVSAARRRAVWAECSHEPRRHLRHDRGHRLPHRPSIATSQLIHLGRRRAGEGAPPPYVSSLAYAGAHALVRRPASSAPAQRFRRLQHAESDGLEGESSRLPRRMPHGYGRRTAIIGGRG